MAVITKLIDIKSRLLDIQRLNGEINSALDLIEHHRNGQSKVCQKSTGPAKVVASPVSEIQSDKDKKTNDTSGNSNQPSVGTNSVNNETTLTGWRNLTSDAGGGEKTDLSTPVEQGVLDGFGEEGDVFCAGNSPTPTEEPDVGGEGTTRTGEMGVHSAPVERGDYNGVGEERDVASCVGNDPTPARESDVGCEDTEVDMQKASEDEFKNLEGFTEKLDLKVEHVMYGSQLRRQRVELNQDNRLCEKFSFEPNKGNAAEEDEEECFNDFEDHAERSNLNQGHSASPLGQTEAAASEQSVTVSGNSSSTSYSGTDAEPHRNSDSDATAVKNQTEVTLQMQDTETRIVTGRTFSDHEQSAAKAAVELARRAGGAKMTRKEWIELLMDQSIGLTGLSGEANRSLIEAAVNSAVDEDGNIRSMSLVRSGFGATSFVSRESQDEQYQPPTVRLPPIPKEAEESTSDEETEKLVEIEISQWIVKANEEIHKGREARENRERGMDTIFCLDTSRSMKGVAWQQAVNFIKKFLEGIEDSNLMDRAFEHVALVTFGSETCVQQHLTCDYLEITRKLDQLEPNGTSPLYAGLQMVHATVIGSGTTFVANGYKMHPRVYLITDGKPTPARWLAGPDKCSHAEFLREHLPVLGLVKELHEKFHIKINPVPVGSYELSMLEMIASNSKGKIVSPEDWRLQSRSFKNYLKASQMGCVPPELSSYWLNTISSGASPDDMAQIEEFLKTHKRGSASPDSDDDDDNQDENLPPLGSRVQLQEEDSPTDIYSMRKGFLGTVTKHMSDGFIGVTWDRPKENGSRREKLLYNGGNGPVIVVDSPRMLKDDELIEVGCRVRRGPDWHYEDQDGGLGNLGSVYKVDPNGIVKVRWWNGHTNSYRFGCDGQFDLEIVGQERKAKEVQKAKKEAPSTIRSEENIVGQRNVRNLIEKANDFCPVGDSEQAAGAVGGVPADKELNETYEFKSFEDIMNAKNSSIIRTVKGGRTESDKESSLNETDIKATRGTDKKENVSADHEVSRISSVPDSKEVATAAADTNRVTQSVESAGARQKTYVKSHADQGETVPGQWFWREGNEWQAYPSDITHKIEDSFKNNPAGTTVIKFSGAQFRIIFPRMEQVNVKTREKQRVMRKAV